MGRLIVVGGGPAGLMAAGQAAALGAEVLLVEKMSRPARKLRISGKGRCNLTNHASQSEFIAHFGQNGRFLRQAFARFFAPDLVAFFEDLGLKLVTERGGRIFPARGQATEVVDALVGWVRYSGVNVQTSARAMSLLIEGGDVAGIKVVRGEGSASKEQRIEGDAVILAMGGASYPATGSTGYGYALAASAGHTIVPPRPALVPLETAGDVAQRLDGLKLRNVKARVLVGDEKRSEAFGELAFTEHGLTGPIIRSQSKLVVDALGEGKPVAVSIDLKPALDKKKLDARLLRDLDAHGKRSFRTLLKDLLPQALIPICLEATGIAADKPGHQVTAAERNKLRAWLKDLRLDVTGHRDWDEAIITAGGIDTREVDPRTMASRLVPGLYFAGEILDVDADTGGYNLQAAFSTGYVSGRAASAGMG